MPPEQTFLGSILAVRHGSGESMKRLAGLYGLSRERVRQLIEAHNTRENTDG